MITNGVVRSSCDLCSQHCGVLVQVEEGKPTRVEGDPDSPINKGELCAKGLASLEYLYHPDRLEHPLRRVGERGEGKWQQISWGEALDTIASECIKARDRYGAESVVVIRGAHRRLQYNYSERFWHLFGTPNQTSQSFVCHVPRTSSSELTCGFFPIPDYEYPPACILSWGSNVVETRLGEYWRTTHALDKGSKLIVIDPRKTELAHRANLWLQPRPGSDLALALGMMHTIIDEVLFDKDFVDNWTVGFDEFRVHAQNYPPEKVESVTWVPAEKIREAARFYATTRPACIQSGNGLDHNVNSFQAGRALSILSAITGNLGAPGGDTQWSFRKAPLDNSPEFRQLDKMPIDRLNRRVGADCMLPIVSADTYIRWALPQMVTKAIVEADPYPIRVAYVQSANPLITWANSQNTYRVLKQLDFLVVADMFMTPTAGLADVVLPVAGYLEFDSITQSPYHPVLQVQQKVAEIDERWSEFRIFTELAKRLGLGDYFWEDATEFLDFILKPTGLTFDEFKKVGRICGIKQYRSYRTGDFGTPSGKVEIYSHRLKEWGFEPLPTYHELPETPYSDPELAKDYPLIFTSGKSIAYRHSQGRQISSLRDSHPEPLVMIHPETASKLEIKERDWVYIETKRGRIKQRATLSTSVDPRVIVADIDWWFPEGDASQLYGWAESNLNVLTDNEPPYNREMGSTNLRGILCKVYKVA